MSKAVRPYGSRNAASLNTGPEQVPTYTVALSDALLERGRAVLFDGSLPSIADALCMLGPPFGDGFGAVGRMSQNWLTQPLANSYDAREALDGISVDEDDLIRLREVLARDFTIAPRESRVLIGNTIVELDMVMAWTSGAAGAVQLAGLSACHSRRSPDADERLLAAAAALAYAADVQLPGFPAYGRWGSAAGATKGEGIVALVETTEAILRAFAERRMSGHTSATKISEKNPSDNAVVVAHETADLLRAMPVRLPFVDSGTDSCETFASLLCPGRVAEFSPEATRREDLRRDYAAWATHLMLTHAAALPFVEGFMRLVADMMAGRRFSVPGVIDLLDEVEMLSLPDDPEDPVAACLSDIVRAVRLRLNLYAAHQGDPTAAARIASWSAGFAVARIGRNTFWPMMVASLAWAERSAIAHPFALLPNVSPRIPDVDDVMNEPVASRLDHVAAGLAHALATVTVVRDDGAESEERSFGGLWRRSVATPAETRRAVVARADALARGRNVGKEAVVVVRSIAEGKTNAAREMQAEFQGMLGEPIPLVCTRDVREAYRKLVAEAPHARAIIDVVLRDTAGSRTAAWRPTILVGKPGSGKTWLCLRICQELHLPHRVFACGGVSDSSFNGTSRQWSTGRASVPLQMIRQHRVANPAIVLDEIDKVGEGRQNGNLVDGLLSMLEPLNSSGIFDPYLEGEVDLHRVLWLATANDAGALHPALLDRLRILEMPDPRADDLTAVLPGVTSAIVERRGLSPEWIAPFDATELDIIAGLWPGGSMRRLARIVEVILDARDNPQRAN
ncbi:AAA family ATPase [Bradyrhizobium sp. Ash2021]|uniref:AAA family ATPase n=1 Tax=Bradyrhizobium sp. Ash2021 TaxID=2954771 RepID=UPI002814BA1B|nr:AAA family ATPase [Bradyrhizobium sp. Ash2021]WMT76480.1 AAA family ATPase [Bradyrhizobium sp. Ash2021]